MSAISSDLSGDSSPRNPHVQTWEFVIRTGFVPVGIPFAEIRRVSGTTTVSVDAEGNRSKSGRTLPRIHKGRGHGKQSQRVIIEVGEGSLTGKNSIHAAPAWSGQIRPRK